MARMDDKSITLDLLITLNGNRKINIEMQVLNGKDIRMQCEARERYERDRISLFDSGKREGHAEGYADGLSKGHVAGLNEGHATGLEEGIANAINMMKDTNASKETTISQLVKQFGLSKEDAAEKVKKYWE